MIKHIRKAKIRGKVFKISWFKDKDFDIDFDGLCNIETKTIKIRSNMTDKRTMEVLIHEFLHAFFWDISEEAVNEVAGELTNILKSLA